MLDGGLGGGREAARKFNRNVISPFTPSTVRYRYRYRSRVRGCNASSVT